jgi:hypothetical protein
MTHAEYVWEKRKRNPRLDFEICERSKDFERSCSSATASEEGRRKSPNIIIQFGCVDSGEEIPSNIPNLEVKLTCGEGSARGTWCQNSKMHPPFL